MTAARRMEDAGMKHEQAEADGKRVMRGADPVDFKTEFDALKTDVVAALDAWERRFYAALLASHGLLFIALKLFP